MFTMPELLTLMLSVEALEDNEVVTVHGARQIGRITSPKRSAALFEKLDNPKTVISYFPLIGCNLESCFFFTTHNKLPRVL